MKPLFLHSERFPPTGTMSADGLKRVLGKAQLDRLQLVIRELAQNSWDARRDGANVSFGIAVTTLRSEPLRVLRDAVFADLPPGLNLTSSLLRAEKAGLRVMVVGDRGTVGLGGPTRADIDPPAGSPLNFLKFMRNFGYGGNAAGSGGTYGYGKSAAYVASRADTIIVYSRFPRRNGAPVSRFMASALGDRRGVLTGRHWWGVPQEGIAEPVEGAAADDLARATGLSVMSGDETGTDIMIIDPSLEDQDDDGPAMSIEDRVSGAILWNLWPKMIHRSGHGPAMRIGVRVDGRDVHLPDPRTTDPFRWLCDAYDLATRPDLPLPPGAVREPIVCLRPYQPLGTLAVVKGPVGTDAAAAIRPPWAGAPRHIALLRTPELVVRYEEHAWLPAGDFGYLGVFRVGDEVDAAFRDAEPPTHDAWNPEQLQDATAKRFVNAASRRRREVIDHLIQPLDQVPDAPEPGTPTGRFAALLGSILLPAMRGGIEDGETPPGDKRRAANGPTRAKGRVEMVGEAVLTDGPEPLIHVRFMVLPAPGLRPTAVRAELGIALDDGTLESGGPEGTPRPTVERWTSPDGATRLGEVVEIDAVDSGTWTLVVRPVDDAVTSVRVVPVESE